MNPEVDARLSALLDGELSPEEAEALRAEVARSPELTVRLAALAAVDDGLRALPGPRVPGDLRARIERQLRAGRPVRPRVTVRQAPRRALRSGAISGRRRWLAAAALAAAAALVLLALPRLRGDETQLAHVEPAPAAKLPVAPPAPEPAPAPAPRVQIAEQAPPTPAFDEQPVGVEELAEAEDLPVIEVLDVLAELDELEQVGSG